MVWRNILPLAAGLAGILTQTRLSSRVFQVEHVLTQVPEISLGVKFPDAYQTAWTQ